MVEIKINSVHADDEDIRISVTLRDRPILRPFRVPTLPATDFSGSVTTDLLRSKSEVRSAGDVVSAAIKFAERRIKSERESAQKKLERKKMVAEMEEKTEAHIENCRLRDAIGIHTVGAFSATSRMKGKPCVDISIPRPYLGMGF